VVLQKQRLKKTRKRKIARWNDFYLNSVFTGIPGLDGPRGDVGLPGVGQSGETGITGEPGRDGLPGSRGPVGLKGNEGVPGFPGMKGEKASHVILEFVKKTRKRKIARWNDFYLNSRIKFWGKIT
jgi:hypothetical protein